MPLASRPLATAPLAGYVLDAIAQPAGALVIRQTVAAVQAEGALALKQVVAQPQPAGELLLYQDVQTRYAQAAGELVLRQQVLKIQPAGQLRLLQRVIDATVPVARQHVPKCYVIINGQPFTHHVSLSNITVNHAEDGNATGSFFAHFPIDEQIIVPAFNGKTVEVYTHADSPVDPVTGKRPRPTLDNPLIPLITGRVNRATHDHTRKGIQFECSDLRGKRLAKEDKDQLRALTGALYSKVTQAEDAEGADYVRELMRTVPGSLAYTRAGDLHYYSWGTAGKPVDWTLTNADVHNQDLTTEFATLDQIYNQITIKLQYRYQLLQAFYTNVHAQKEQQLILGSYYNPALNSSVQIVDWRVFNRDAMIEKAQSFDPWETLSYEIFPAFNYYFVPGIGQARVAWTSEMPARCRGFSANLVRNISQPVTEDYEITLTAPQSIDAYGETVPGSTLSYAIDTEYDSSKWETDFSHVSAAKGQGDTGAPLVQRISAARAEADNRRTDLAEAFAAAVAIGEKELIKNHRQNYVTAVLKNRILPAELGQVVRIETRVPTTTGQIVGINWRFGDGIRETQLRIAVAYMDTSVPAPVKNIVQPAAPAKPGTDTTLESTAGYNPDTKALEINVAEIPEQYTDERKPDPIKATFEIPLETTGITLINGH
jgi:hypothetical protein